MHFKCFSILSVSFVLIYCFIIIAISLSPLFVLFSVMQLKVRGQRASWKVKFIKKVLVFFALFFFYMFWRSIHVFCFLLFYLNLSWKIKFIKKSPWIFFALFFPRFGDLSVFCFWFIVLSYSLSFYRLFSFCFLLCSSLIKPPITDHLLNKHQVTRRLTGDDKRVMQQVRWVIIINILPPVMVSCCLGAEEHSGTNWHNGLNTAPEKYK